MVGDNRIVGVYVRLWNGDEGKVLAVALVRFDDDGYQFVALVEMKGGEGKLEARSLCDATVLP